MNEHPVFETTRLILRPFTLDDANDVQRLAGEKAIADTTLNIPHPYENGMAEEWITTHRKQMAAGEVAVFAIGLREGKALVGAIGLTIHQQFNRAEFGYWIGCSHWNKGYCTEAGKAVFRYGFETLNLNRIFAFHMTRNPASGRVMQKLGMVHEGHFRQHVKKWDKYEDLEFYGILRADWTKDNPTARRS
jgi:RimJ/RimL family protein N-acetyltransferase